MTAETLTLERPDTDWIRDGYGRPIILPDPRWMPTPVGPNAAPASWIAPDGSIYPDRRYTRVTTFGEALLDGSALSRWKMRRVALGMGRRPDYVTAAAALTAEDRDRAALNDLAEKCLEAAGPNAADIGTALHQFTERLDRGEDVGFVPPEYRADLDAYRQVIEPLTFTHRECRMVCDQLETAGTPDAIALCSEPDPDGVVDAARIVDLKTGNVDYTAGKFSTQLAIYAHSALYDPRDGTRTALEISDRWGLVIHMPAGMGTAQLRWLRLDHGWAGALLAGPVREWRKPGARELTRPVYLPDGVRWSADGTCQGTYKSGDPCRYRAQDNGFCSRHQAQAGGDAVVAVGLPAVDVVQTWVDNAVQDVQEAQDRLEDTQAQLAERQQELAAVQPAAAAAELSTDESTAVDEVEQDDSEPVTGEPVEGVCGNCGAVTDQLPCPFCSLEDDLGDATGELEAVVGVVVEDPPEDRCDTTGLLVSQCACRVHRPDLAGIGDDGVEQDEVRELHLPRPPVPPLPYRAVTDTDLAAVARADTWEGWPIQGRKIQDPMDPQQLQGNPRPHTTMGTPEDAGLAALYAERSLLAQVAGCRSRTELELLWNATADAWTPAVREAAAQRARDVERQPATERTSAALWQAIRSADSEGTLLQLWQDQSLNPLWTDAHRAAAAARMAELRS